MEPQPRPFRFGSVPETLANLAWRAYRRRGRCRWDTSQWKCVRFQTEQGKEDVWVSVYPVGSWNLDERTPDSDGSRARLKDRLLHDRYEVFTAAELEAQEQADGRYRAREMPSNESRDEDDAQPSTSSSVGCVRKGKRKRSVSVDEMPKKKSKKSQSEQKRAKKCPANKKPAKKRQAKKKPAKKRQAKKKPAKKRQVKKKPGKKRQAKKRQAKRKLPKKKQEPNNEEDVRPSTSSDELWQIPLKSCLKNAKRWRIKWYRTKHVHFESCSYSSEEPAWLGPKKKKKWPTTQSECDNTTGSTTTSVTAPDTETEMQVECSYEEAVQPSTSTAHGPVRGVKTKNSESTKEILMKQSQQVQEESSNTTGSRKATNRGAKKRRAKKK